MKKLLLITAALISLSATAAEAQISLDIGINEEPAYVQRPATYPTYVSGRERHHNYDWNYWHQQQLAREEQARREAEERRIAEARAHHDNGRHLGHLKHGHDDHGHR